MTDLRTMDIPVEGMDCTECTHARAARDPGASRRQGR